MCRGTVGTKFVNCGVVVVVSSKITWWKKQLEDLLEHFFNRSRPWLLPDFHATLS